MNDRRSDDPGAYDPDSYGNRSWEEFLRHVRREESGTGPDEEAGQAPPADAGGEDTPRDAPSDPVDEPREPRPDDRAPSQEERAPRAGPGARPPGDARVVMPPEDEVEEAHRRRRRLIAGAATVALVVGAFLFYDQVVTGRDGGRSATGSGASAERVQPASPEPGEDPAVAADRPDTADPAEPLRTPSGAEERTAAFTARADTLAEAIASFRERRRDFELGRIGCEGLARGLREVRSAVAGLRAVAGEEGAGLAPPARERYRRLLGDVRTVEETFSETGCPAPS